MTAKELIEVLERHIVEYGDKAEDARIILIDAHGFVWWPDAISCHAEEREVDGVTSANLNICIWSTPRDR